MQTVWKTPRTISVLITKFTSIILINLNLNLKCLNTDETAKCSGAVKRNFRFLANLIYSAFIL